MARSITPTQLPENPSVETIAEFGTFIRSMRTQLGLRIDDAASLCGVSVALLSALENGKSRDIGLSKVLRVAHQLGLAVLVIPQTNLPRALTCLDEGK